jgi:transketolase
MPGIIVIRPADANEVVEAWRVILQIKDHPVSLVLSRQALPTLDRTKYRAASGLSKGAYVLIDAPDAKPNVLLMATGSEVSLCVAAHEQLASEGIKARVISMPSWELFESQSPEYRDTVLPPAVTARVAVEEASPFGWERYTGLHGTIIGIHTFGLSAPIAVVQRHFGFTPEHVVNAARQQVAR